MALSSITASGTLSSISCGKLAPVGISLGWRKKLVGKMINAISMPSCVYIYCVMIAAVSARIHW